MAIKVQCYLENLYAATKPDFEKPYLTIEKEIIKTTVEKTDIKIKDIFNLIVPQLYGMSFDEEDLSIHGLDDWLLLLEGIEQNINFYYGKFHSKIAHKSPFLSNFNFTVITTTIAYETLIEKIQYLQEKIDEQKTTIFIPCIFDPERIENDELTIAELIKYGTLAFKKAIDDPVWREGNEDLLRRILDILFHAAETAQLSEEQIEPFIELLDWLEDFFGEETLWMTTPATDKYTGKEKEIYIHKLAYLAGPQNNLLSS